MEISPDTDSAVRGIANGATVLIGGFGRAGCPSPSSTPCAVPVRTISPS